MSYITSIGTASPAHKFNQQTIAAFMARAMQLNAVDTRKLCALYRATGIDTRYSVLEDYGRTDDFTFYENSHNLEPFPATSQRLQVYRQCAVQLSIAAVQQCLAKRPGFDNQHITHLIVVSCTGMYAPGLDIDLVKALNLNSSVQRTAINFMGCYAAFNGVKTAHHICQSQREAKVLVVCTELCSLHFQKENNEDNWLANALFADGSAALLMENTPAPGVNLKPTSFYCDLALQGEEDMAWAIGDRGFEMRLSSYIPNVIRTGIHQLTMALLQHTASTVADIEYFAIHPGGKKILEVIEEELGLTKDHNRFAYNILRQYGNMSSPTVLFVLASIAETLNGVDNGKKVLSFAFGPGLTLESMLLTIETH